VTGGEASAPATTAVQPRSAAPPTAGTKRPRSIAARRGSASGASEVGAGGSCETGGAKKRRGGDTGGADGTVQHGSRGTEQRALVASRFSCFGGP